MIYRMQHVITVDYQETYLMQENVPVVDGFLDILPKKQIFIVLTDRIGDTLNSLYFIHNLRHHFPEAQLTYVGKRFGDTRFLSTIIGQNVDRVLFIENLTSSCINELTPDIIFDLNPKDLLPGQFQRHGYRIGHNSSCHLRVPQIRLNFKANEHLNLLRAVGFLPELRHPEIILRPRGFSDDTKRIADSPYVALCLEATSNAWTMFENVADGLIEFLLATTELNIILLGNNINGHGHYCRNSSPRVVNLTGQTSLLESLAILQHAQMVIAVDTGLMHAASYLGVPLLAVFTCGCPERNGPQGQRGKVVVLRTVVTPPTGVWEKSDSRQSGAERHAIRLDHLIFAIDRLRDAGERKLSDRIKRRVSPEYENIANEK